MRIGIYGGAFNPVHNGHLKCMLAALETGTLDEEWVVPTWHNAFGKDMAPFDIRVSLLEQAKPNDSRIKIQTLEQDFQITYTVDLVERLALLYPDNTWVLLVGPDIDLTKWRRWENLTKLVSVQIIPEQGPDRSTWVRQAIKDGNWTAVDGMVPKIVAENIRLQKTLYR